VAEDPAAEVGDAAVPALLADQALAANSPVVANWYYANGEVWVLGPHLFAMIPVAIGVDFILDEPIGLGSKAPGAINLAHMSSRKFMNVGIDGVGLRNVAKMKK